MSDEAITDRVGTYYSGKLHEHGMSARGVDWNSEASQELRFDQLLHVLPESGRTSLLDYGCGYGALLDVLRSRGRDIEYYGYDLSADMVRAAQERHPNATFTRDAAALAPAEVAVASGIFNVRLDIDGDRWASYVEATISELARLGTRGFAFNMLTSWSDEDRRRDDLFYGDPTYYFELCKREYSRNVALLHDYDLYEFTIVVRSS